MARLSLRALPCAALLLVASSAHPQAPAEPDPVKGKLILQMTILEAEKYLIEREPGKAVELLESRLAQVQANRRYLMVLRDAYRAYLTDLKLNNQPALAEKYQARMRILDGEAPAPPAAKVPVTAALAGGIVPPKRDATARAKPHDDPFDLANRAAPEPGKSKEATGLVAQADGKFELRHYGDACRLYDEASRTDGASVQGSREKWAYCKLHRVVEQVNSGAGGESLAGLEQEVKAALAMAPHLEKTGKWLLGEIESRRGKAVAPAAQPPREVAVKHVPGGQGWKVAETEHFRVYHNQPQERAEAVARVAEETRSAMYRKWFGGPGEAWAPKCEIYLHATADEYSRQTGVPKSSPGHTRIETDPMTKRVVCRRIHLHCQSGTVLATVLPHEATHVVLAGQFDGHQVPRWADEGMAVLTEPREKVEEHRRNLVKCLRNNELFGVRELMELSDYPSPARITTFYAQSVSLVDYLSGLKGSVTFARFVREGLRDGYEASLRRHYGIQGFADLQERWGKQVTAQLGGTGNGYAGR